MSVVQTDQTLPVAAAPVTENAAGPSRAALELSGVLHALSDPVRLQIVYTLACLEAGGELACKAFELPVVKSTRTHHFRVLREAGVIRQRMCGTTRLSTLRRDDLDARFPGLLDAVLGAAARD